MQSRRIMDAVEDVVDLARAVSEEIEQGRRIPEQVLAALRRATAVTHRAEEPAPGPDPGRAGWRERA